MKRVLPLLAILVALCSFSVAEQEEQLAVHVKEMRVPQMMGVVHNHRNEPVAGVRVEILRRENGWRVLDAKTDDQGRFASPNLKNGRYNIKVHHNGIEELYHVHITPQNASPELVLKFK